MIQIVTTKGVRDMGMEETQQGQGQIYELLREIEKIGEEDGKLLCVICRRETIRLTLFDMMLNTLHVALLLLSPTRGVVYPANVLKRRASALCANV